jgi:hypothetical protein
MRNKTTPSGRGATVQEARPLGVVGNGYEGDDECGGVVLPGRADIIAQGGEDGKGGDVEARRGEADRASYLVDFTR